MAISNRQMQALEYFIAISKDAHPIARKTIIWTLRQTQNFTRPVKILIPRIKKHGLDWAKLTSCGIHDMISACGSTEINTLLLLMNCGFFFNHASYPECAIVWLSPKPYGNDPKSVTPDFEEIKKITEVEDPHGAYPPTEIK